MTKEETIEKLKNLNDSKLIDVFKNHDYYGYSAEVRDMAKQLLHQRGFSNADLEISPSSDRNRHQQLERLYISFKWNSIMAFVFFGLFLLSIILLSISSNEISAVRSIYRFIFWLAITLYVVFLIRALINQYRFDRLTKREGIVDGLLIFFFLGVPFYFLMYIRWRNQMKETLHLRKTG